MPSAESTNHGSKIGLETEEFASAINRKPASVRVRLCQTGSYFGIKPRKLPNGRLLWPLDGPQRFVEGRSDVEVD